jgi:hypothetical protein
MAKIAKNCDHNIVPGSLGNCFFFPRKLYKASFILLKRRLDFFAETPSRSNNPFKILACGNTFADYKDLPTVRPVSSGACLLRE